MGSSPSSAVSLTGGLSFPEETSRSLSFWSRVTAEGGGHRDRPAGTPKVPGPPLSLEDKQREEAVGGLS